MMNIIFAGQNAEKTAETLFPEAMMIDAKSRREIDADCDVIGFVITLSSVGLHAGVNSTNFFDFRLCHSKRDPTTSPMIAPSMVFAFSPFQFFLPTDTLTAGPQNSSNLF